MSSLRRDVMKNGLPPLPSQFPAGGASKFAGLVPKRKKKDFSPVGWNEYFETEKDVYIGENKFHLYAIGSSGPLLLLLHGAGHSALSWAVFAKTIQTYCDCQIIAMDFRGHGETETTDDMNMDANVMAKDVSDVLHSHLKDLPSVVILGHSMGGAIAVHIAVQNLIPSLKGLAVIDVVEGTALDALPSMQSFLRSRPPQFKSLECAIEWSIRGGQLKNVESAKVSMAGQLKRITITEMPPPEPISTSAIILSEADEDMGKGTCTDTDTHRFKNAPKDMYLWRVDLSKTEPHWQGWFKDMSTLFLSCSVPKLLILAGVDRLDKELTIGQMQGKFQMQILANCGHMVHEDVPEKVGELVATFLLRQKLSEAKGGFKRSMPEC